MNPAGLLLLGVLGALVVDEFLLLCAAFSVLSRLPKLYGGQAVCSVVTPPAVLGGLGVSNLDAAV